MDGYGSGRQVEESDGHRVVGSKGERFLTRGSALRVYTDNRNRCSDISVLLRCHRGRRPGSLDEFVVDFPLDQIAIGMRILLRTWLKGCVFAYCEIIRLGIFAPTSRSQVIDRCPQTC